MPGKSGTIRIPYDKLKTEFIRVLLKNGFPQLSAERCAEIFAGNSLDGVNTHGINRFPRFVRTKLEGYIKPDAKPSLIMKSGALEQWNADLGPGPLNAAFATDRAMEIASEFGIGMVGLANSNHWMRGGTYGWQAARKGFVFIGWTNTCPNMPAWGATDPRLGNNPLVIAVPFNDEAIVLDFALSQYSYGRLDSYRREGNKLPYPGGFDREGKMTINPEEILDSWRIMPVGYWKGAGLSLLLDVMATIFSGGKSTHDVKSCNTEHGVSQVFIAVKINKLENFPVINDTINRIIDDLHSSNHLNPSEKVRYPGENILHVRKDNRENGVSVDQAIWEKLRKM